MGFKCGRRRGGGRPPGSGMLVYTVLSHQDLAEDDGEQKKEKSFGRVWVLS